MPPRSHTHAAATLSPRKTRSGRKRTNSALSDLSVKAPKKRRETDAEQEQETEKRKSELLVTTDRNPPKANNNGE
ncbi:hypothetical protein JOM56_012769 [Amanita muscaria]